MDDTISRQVTIDAFYQYPNVTWTTLDVMEKINELPSVQSTLYGYNIEHLKLIVEILRKKIYHQKE